MSLLKTLIVGLGFVGKHLAAELLGQDPDNLVTAIDTYEPSGIFNFEKMAKWENDPRFVYLWQSAGDTARIFNSIHEYDNIIYTAAIADVPYTLNSPLHTMQANVMNTTSFMEMLRVRDFHGRFILLSSESVYGKQPPEQMPLKEDTCVIKPDNIYAISKACQETVVRGFAETYGIPYIVFRSATMFGEFSRLKQAIPIFVRQALRGEPITLEGDGSQTRDFNYVMNMVKAITTVLPRPESSMNIWNQIYNIGSGEEIQLYNIARTVSLLVGPANKAGKKSEIEHKPWRVGEQGKRVSLSIEKAQKAFDYYPLVKTLDGIRDVILWMAWYHENYDVDQMEDLQKRFPSGQTFEQEQRVGTRYSDINPDTAKEERPELTPEIVAQAKKVTLPTPNSGGLNVEENRVMARIKEISDEALAAYQKKIREAEEQDSLEGYSSKEVSNN